jgi:hypothetical protein
LENLGLIVDLGISPYTVFGHFTFGRYSVVFLFDGTVSSFGLVVRRVAELYVVSFYLSIIEISVNCFGLLL